MPEKWLERGLRRARQQPNYFVAVIAVSFDRLKSINDSLGHAAGDQLLTQAAQRFESCLRGEDVVVGRLGGDEIALLLFDIRDRESATGTATRLVGTLSEPFDVGGRNVYAPASLGVALGMSGYERAEETAMLRGTKSGLPIQSRERTAPSCDSRYRVHFLSSGSRHSHDRNAFG